MTKPTPLEAIRRRLALKVGEHAAFDGWTAKAVDSAAAELGIDAAQARLAFPKDPPAMVEAEFRIMFNRDEALLEGGDFRYFYSLKLQFDRLPTFPAALTLRHVIDKHSPLYGATPATQAMKRPHHRACRRTRRQAIDHAVDPIPIGCCFRPCD